MIIKKYLVSNMNEALTRIRYELGKDAIIVSQRKVRKPGFKGLFSEKQIEVTAYLVSNMNEALTRIRYELGKDAIIVSQRKVRKPGFKGLFSEKQIEVTAAVENSSKGTEENFQSSINDIRKIMEQEIENKQSEVSKPSISTKEEKEEKLEAEVKEMKELLNKVIKNTTKEEERDPIKEVLEKIDIDLEFYNELKDRIDIEHIENSLKEVINADIEISEENLKGRIVLVGPTGVGKTTTIAKLAGKLSLIEKKKVGLITVDTYRIGAVEQLKTYAEIMNIPFKVVVTIKEMEEAIEALKGMDVILIDTTGRSSKNTMQISELRAFTEKAKPDSVSMVISATTKNRDVETILQGYKYLNYDNIIITKLDETTTYGAIYNISKRSQKPIR